MKRHNDNKELTERITVRISEGDRAWLSAEAKRRGGCGEGEVVRTLIRQVLALDEEAEARPRRHAR